MANSELKVLNEEKETLLQYILNNNFYGKRIYLIGSSEFGPTNEPILVKSTQGLYNKFGKIGTLANAFHCIKYIDDSNQVFLVKTTGEHSITYLNINIPKKDVIHEGLVISACESNEIYNDVCVVVDTDKLSIKYPEELGVSDRSYYYEQYPTVERLITKINEDARNKRGKVNAYSSVDPATPTKTAFIGCNSEINYLYGGECGLYYTKDMLYNYLDRTYELLESEDIDIIIPVDAFLDDVYPHDSYEEQYQYNLKYYHSTKDYLTSDTFGNQYSYLNQLVNFCIRQLRFGVITHGVMGFNSIKNIRSNYLYESDDIAEMFKACLDYNLALLDEPDYKFMVSVVAGDIGYNFGSIIDNGYLAFASFAASIQKISGITNIPIPSISLYNEFSEPVLEDLCKHGINTFRQSPLYEKPVIYNAVTLHDDENLKLFVNTRMIQMAVAYLNKLFQLYIGYNMETLLDNGVIEQDIRKVMDTIQQLNVITSYYITIQPIYRENHIKIELVLTTNYMVKPVTIHAQVQVQRMEEY